jgi:hypothetical protein
MKTGRVPGAPTVPREGCRRPGAALPARARVGESSSLGPKDAWRRPAGPCHEAGHAASGVVRSATHDRIEAGRWSRTPMPTWSRRAIQALLSRRRGNGPPVGGLGLGIRCGGRRPIPLSATGRSTYRVSRVWPVRARERIKQGTPRHAGRRSGRDGAPDPSNAAPSAPDPGAPQWRSAASRRSVGSGPRARSVGETLPSDGHGSLCRWPCFT